MKSNFSINTFADKINNGKWFMSGVSHKRMLDMVESYLKNPSAYKAETPANSFDYGVPAGDTNLAVIYIEGILYKGASDEAKAKFGLCNTDDIYNQLIDAMDDESVSEIVLFISSPGGEVTGIEELARKIAEVDKVKPVYAWTETESCSAALWLMAQARTVGMTYSAEVGSVGVYTMVEIIYEALAKNGIRVETFSAGEFKLMRHGLRDLTDKEKEIIQGEINAIYTTFKEAVLSKRTIADEDLQGLTFMGRLALDKGFVDVLADNFEEFLSVILTTPPNVEG